MDIVQLGIAIVLVVLNGFFVAAEFALVKLRGSRIDLLVDEGRPFATTAQWLSRRLDESLSACQLGITMASLGLGWVGEPAFARLVEPVCQALGMTSDTAIHTIAFIIAFTTITALHLVVGEQVPKIFAIREPERIMLWCAVPLKMIYVLLYPLLVCLNRATTLILGWLGVGSSGDHDTPHSEEEIRELVYQAHAYGELTRNERELIHAVFRFDDQISRRVMVPRTDVVIFDVNDSFADCLKLARRTRHTRFPLCDGSLDKVLGVVHIKDLMGISAGEDFELRKVARPPKQVSENMPVSRLLRHFQATHQHLAFVVDEHGTISGIVTLKNVLEQIVGPVEDEFDLETPDIVPDGPGRYIVAGSASIAVIREKLGLPVDDSDVDTLSGLLTAHSGEIPAAGDEIQLEGATAEVLEVKHARAEKVRVTIHRSDAS